MLLCFLNFKTFEYDFRIFLLHKIISNFIADVKFHQNEYLNLRRLGGGPSSPIGGGIVPPPTAHSPRDDVTSIRSGVSVDDDQGRRSF